MGRTNEITDFLAGIFGPYPFEANGAIVDDYDNLFFALENQTRSIYSKYFFERGATTGETYVVAHELAHQWFGDSVAVEQWDDLWLNEGFATYAEWLWSEKIGEGTPQEIFDFLYAQPLSAPYWAPPPGDPGPVDLFDDSVYVRGAMTLQALRSPSATRTSSRSSVSGTRRTATRTARPRSSSGWPNASPASSSTACSRRGCSPTPNHRTRVGRRQRSRLPAPATSPPS
ncbi:M1 family aminopeptidase [Micromonospora sp. CPCC 206061]|uniref:M1 family aminopeptidase n=1 Tax=Micromonospora sp. CPCC 206061 TaxID=3122410 RepID=UPI002FF172F4